MFQLVPECQFYLDIVLYSEYRLIVVGNKVITHIHINRQPTRAFRCRWLQSQKRKFPTTFRFSPHFDGNDRMASGARNQDVITFPVDNIAARMVRLKDAQRTSWQPLVANNLFTLIQFSQWINAVLGWFRCDSVCWCYNCTDFGICITAFIH